MQAGGDTPGRGGRGIYAVLLVFTALLLTDFHLYRANTLYHNGSWESTKVNLSKGVIGAVAFFTSRMTLSGNRLNLGSWNGLNEVTYKKKVNPREIQFDFKLEGHAYIIFEYDRNDRGFSGIRFSRSNVFDHMVFTAGPDGEFISKSYILGVNFRDEWNHVRVAFDERGVRFLLNGVEVANDPNKPLHDQEIGFRSSTDPTYIDNVVIRQNGQPDFHETFHNTTGLLRCFMWSLVFLSIISCGLTVLLSRGGSALYGNILVLGVIAVCAGLFYAADFYRLSRRYPEGDSQIARLIQSGDMSRFRNNIENEKEISENVAARYPLSAPGKYRIIFQGSSQTWGAGASNDEDSFVSVFERELNANGTRKYECLNPSVPRFQSTDLWRNYSETFSRYGPRMTIVNLSYNDENPEAFEEALEKYARFDASRGIRTVFILEAAYIEANSLNLPRNHEIMRRVARKHGIQLVDLDSYMKKHKDDGLEWWDDVHMTSFGQELAAKHLYESLMPLH